MKNKLYSARSAGKLLGFCNQTIINWVNKGYIRAFKTPGGQLRIYPTDLLELINKQEMSLHSARNQLEQDINSGSLPGETK